MKISENLNKWNLLKTCLKFTTLPVSAYLAAIFTMGKKKIFDFLKAIARIFEHSTRPFALNHGKKIQLYFSCVKHQAKYDFLKDVESILYLVLLLTLKLPITTKADEFFFFFIFRRKKS